VSDAAPALQLDQRGRRCPLPIIALGRAIGTVGVGAVIELLADDPAADPDIRAWCRMRGQELVETSDGRFLVRRLR
jgi:tRNA 2-thiouridine synthesizing protein A